MNQSGTKKARGGCGCLGLFWSAVGCFGLFVIFLWPTCLDRYGSAAPGKIAEKHEFIRVHGDMWTRTFELVAAYSAPSHSGGLAGCEVTDKTYDSFHVGNPITVHYVGGGPALGILLPTTHLEPCTTAASFHLYSTNIPKLLLVVAPLLLILFLWRVVRVQKIALWLFLGWLCLMFAYFGIPRVEPVPQHPVASTATVDRIVTIKTLGGLPNRRAIPLLHPYEIVMLKFVPPGMDTAVMAVDKVDAGSVANLNAGQNVSIVYDAVNPRIARLEQGTRLFPGQAVRIVILCGVVYIVLLLIVEGMGWFFRSLGRKVRSETQNLSRGMRG